MRDAEIYKHLNDLNNKIEQVIQFMRLNASGQALFDEAMKNVLQKKGVVTEIELKEQIGEEIRKVNESRAEEPAPDAAPAEIVAPTAAEVAKVEDTKVV